MDRMSVRLYETMEKIGVSEVMRAVHRELVIHEIVMTVRHGIDSGLQGEQGDELYVFGSQTEGTTTFDMGSDVDMVGCLTDVPVYSDIREATGPRSLLMIQDEHSQGGYVKLQGVLYGRPMTIHVYDIESSEDWMFDRHGRVCLKPYVPPGRIRHGPAFDYAEYGIERDGVPALKCLSVPAYAKQWLHRPRPHGWPSRDSLIRMSSLPCFVVGVGHPYSDEQDIEWRLSYSLHERELMFSLNPVQQQCYTFMKMVKKNIIQYIIGGELISSYHFKTCLFWAIEATAPDSWRADNMIPCMKVCFKLLHRFLRRRFCPNFFPEANLFDRESITHLQSHLISLVSAIRSNMCTTITNIQCSGLGSTYITGQVARLVSEGLIYQRLRIALGPISSTLLLNNTITQLSHSRRSSNDRLSTLNALLLHVTDASCITAHTEEQTREAKCAILPLIHFRLATCLAAEGLKLNEGPSREQLLTWSENHLRCSKGRDLAGATLVRASLMYKLRRYDMCELLLEELDSRLTASVMSMCRCDESPEYVRNRTLEMKVEAEIMSAREILTKSIVTSVTFLPCERDLVPEPLLHEMERSRGHAHGAKDGRRHDVYEWATVDGKVYFYFPQYLVYSELNKPVHKLIALDNLFRIIKEDGNLRHKDTALNLLGFVYSSERKPALAFLTWSQSLEYRRDRNAALLYHRDGVEKMLPVD